MKSPGEITVQSQAQKLASEIYQIYNELKEIIPDVHKRIGNAEPGWILLEAGSKATMRDYILRDYAQIQNPTKKSPSEIKQQAMACPLSFDITSNPYFFDIDHFHSRAQLMAILDKIESDQILLGEIKAELKIKGLSDKVLKKLIPNRNVLLKVTGLRNIYYNYPSNLWPLSGPINSSKQDKSPLQFVSQTTLDTMGVFLNETDLNYLLSHIQTELEIDSSEISSFQLKEKKVFYVIVYQKLFMRTLR
jgi:hypothetical protein